MTLLITGTSGHLGRLAVHALLARGTSPADIVATARDTSKIADLAELGVQVRRLDYSDPQSVKEALAGVDRVALVSGSEVGQRVAQHRTVIEAAQDAGVELLAYTSIPKADTTSLLLAEEHRATEQLLADSGLRHSLLRNGWYFENYTENAGPALATGTVVGATAGGRISGAARRDYAEALAAVLLAEDPAQVYELGGDASFTLEDWAAELSRATGQQISHQDLPQAELEQVLVGAGLPAPYAAILADADRGIAQGELLVEGGALSTLIGRPTTPLAQAVDEAFAG